jgi:V8-like Glu-specific endopeptidase
VDIMNVIALLLLVLPPVVPHDGIIHVRRDLSRGHACAIREDILLTARHIADIGYTSHIAWSDLAGNDGTAVVIDADPARDLSVLLIERGRPGRVWALAAEAPRRGDRVRIVGYDDDRRNPAKPRIVEAKVIAVDAGHVDYSKSPGPGSSGYCVLNDDDEVVAINFALTSGPGYEQGHGVSVYGAWAPTLPVRGLR